MAASSDFLSAPEKQRIVDAIAKAENRTSGEIRVHIENWCWLDAYNQARATFTRLGMHKTDEHTGVLIYIAVKSHKLAIIGDKGINEKVPADFWDSILEHMRSCFHESRYADGIVDAVIRAGIQLEEHFPKSERNPNELSNDLSFG